MRRKEKCLFKIIAKKILQNFYNLHEVGVCWEVQKQNQVCIYGHQKCNYDESDTMHVSFV